MAGFLLELFLSNEYLCVGLNIHWAKMAPWHKDLKNIGTGMQNDSGNFENE